jgi:hypothetical protein
MGPVKAGNSPQDHRSPHGHPWTGSQAGALTIDSIDKLDSVLNHFDIGVPGYDWLKEQAAHELA